MVVEWCRPDFQRSIGRWYRRDQPLCGLSPQSSLSPAKTRLQSQQQPRRSIEEVIETLGFARKNEDAEIILHRERFAASQVLNTCLYLGFRADLGGS